MKLERNEDIFFDEIIKNAATNYVHNEGEKLLEEARKLNQEEGKPTVEQIQDFKKLCDKQLRKNKAKVNIFYKISTAVAVLLILVSVSVVSVPAMRGKMIDFLVSVNEECTIIKTKEPDSEGEINKYRIEFEPEYEVTYLPEGFYVESENKTSISKNVNYSDGTMKTIAFMQTIDSSDVNIDSKGAGVSKININGKIVMFTAEGVGEETKIRCIWEEEKYFIVVNSKGVSEEEMIKVIESTKPVK